MELTSGFHPIGQAVLNSRSQLLGAPCYEPVPVANLLRLATTDSEISARFSEMIGGAFVQAGAETPPQAVSLKFLQEGRYTNVVLVEPSDPSLKPIIMQIAKRPMYTPQGKLVAQDHDNLKTIEDRVGPISTPRAYGSGTVAIPELGGTTAVTFTEYLQGYDEINQNPATHESDFYTNTLPEDRKEFYAEDAIEVNREMMAILGEVYAGTFDPNSQKGLLIGDVHIDSGDFVFKRHYDDHEPRVKLVTARQLEPATPNELLTLVLSPTAVKLGFMQGYIGFHTLSAKGDTNRARTAVQGLRRGMRSKMGPEAADALLLQALSQYESTALAQIEDVYNAFSAGSIRTFEDIPLGYRPLIRELAIAELILSDAQRRALTKPGDASTHERAVRLIPKTRKFVQQNIQDFAAAFAQAA